MAATEDVCPEEFTTMIKILYTGMMANVSVGGEVSESFNVTNGIKQGLHWPPSSFPSSYQQCSTRLFKTRGIASTYGPDRTLIYSMSPTSEETPRLLGY